MEVPLGWNKAEVGDVRGRLGRCRVVSRGLRWPST